MRIAILHPYVFRFARGIERFTVSLSTLLAETGQDIHIMTWTWPNEVCWSEMGHSIVVYRMPYVRYFAEKIAVIFYLWRLLVKRYELVVVYFPSYGEAASLKFVNLLRKQPYCIILHYPVNQVPHRYEEFRKSGLARGARSLIAVSEYVASGARQYFGRPCEVITNGVDPELFAPSTHKRSEMRARLGISPTAPVIITLAALEERKGVQLLINALPLLIRDYPDIHYIVLGEGDYRTTLENQIKVLALGSQVSLLGAKQDVVPYLACADIGCLLSYGEAMGIVLIEYMSMELPVVVSRREPFDEFIKPDWGELIDERNSAEVAAKLHRLLADPGRRAEMGRAGRAQVIREYSWSKVAQEYLSAFEKLI